MQLSSQQIAGLYDQYGGLVYRRCRSLTGNDEDAYDLMQESFMRLVINAESLNGTASPLTWLYRVSTNLCLNRLRDARARAKKLQTPDAAATQLPGMSAFASVDLERRKLVMSLLTRVDDETRAIVIYYFVDELTLDEIAELVELSVPTVRKRIQHFQGTSRRLLETETGGLTRLLLLGLILDSLVKGGLRL